MTETFTATEAVELARVTRSGFVESRHIGSAIVLSSDGEMSVAHGNVNAKIMTRSALKPLQSLAMHTAGLELHSDLERAISLASHGGTPQHRQVVRDMLERSGFSEDALLCPADWPMDHAAKVAHIAASGSPLKSAHCCSGKHAAMLLTCAANGWSTDDYTDEDHPLQAAIREMIQRFTGELPGNPAIDGCGAPTYAVTLTGLAKAYRRLTTAELTSPFPLHRQAAKLVQAAVANAWVVESPGKGDSAVMEALGGFAKFGAEGISVVCSADGSVAIVKILDGSLRAARLVASTLLMRAGAVSEDDIGRLEPALGRDITGGTAVVGQIEVTV